MSSESNSNMFSLLPLKTKRNLFKTFVSYKNYRYNTKNKSLKHKERNETSAEELLVYVEKVSNYTLDQTILFLEEFIEKLDIDMDVKDVHVANISEFLDYYLYFFDNLDLDNQEHQNAASDLLEILYEECYSYDDEDRNVFD